MITVLPGEDVARLNFDLKKVQTHLAIAQRLTATGSFGWKPVSGQIAWSDEMHRIFGLDRGTTPTIDFVLSRAHADDRDRLRQILDRATNEAGDVDVEHRIVMPNGSVKHLHVVAHAVPDEATGETEYLGAVIDVTASKASRQALENAYAEIRVLKDRLQSENLVLREETPVRPRAPGACPDRCRARSRSPTRTSSTRCCSPSRSAPPSRSPWT